MKQVKRTCLAGERGASLTLTKWVLVFLTSTSLIFFFEYIYIYIYIYNTYIMAIYILIDRWIGRIKIDR